MKMTAALATIALLGLGSCGSPNAPIPPDHEEPPVIERQAPAALPTVVPQSTTSLVAPPTFNARLVDCRVRSSDWLLVDGLCRFQSDSGESFTLDNGPDLSLRDDILAVSVSVTAPAVAEVRGLTNAGINSR